MQVSVRTSDRVIEQYGESIGERPGCVNEALSAETEAVVMAAMRQPNAGVVLSEDHQTVTPLPIEP